MEMFGSMLWFFAFFLQSPSGRVGSLHLAQVRGQKCPWPLKLVTFTSSRRDVDLHRRLWMVQG